MPRGEGGGQFMDIRFQFFFPGLRSQSRKEPHVFGPLEPEPLQKKLGAGAAQILRLLYWLLEDKKHREIVLLLL